VRRGRRAALAGVARLHAARAIRREHVHAYRAHVSDAGLPWLYATGFIIMGAFVAIYNYIGFRLLAPPFLLSQSAIGAIFVVYLLGSVASAVMGRLADRYGRRNVL